MIITTTNNTMVMMMVMVLEMLCIAAIAVVVYVNTTHEDFRFVYDDLVAVQNNPDVRQLSAMGAVFRNDFWGTELCSPQSHKRLVVQPLSVRARDSTAIMLSLSLSF